MTEFNEKLSTILDEYSDTARDRAVLDAILEDTNAQSQLQRYRLIGEAMRHELPERIDTDLSARVMSQVRQIAQSSEPTSAKPSLRNRPHILWTWFGAKPLIGMAISASVALVSVGLWQSRPTDSQSESAEIQAVSIEQEKIEKLVSQPASVGVVTASSDLHEGTRWTLTNDSPAVQQKLNAYLLNHTEYSTSLQQVLIPQARVAGYDTE